MVATGIDVYKRQDSYSYNEETIYVNDFTAEYQAGLCKTYIDDLIAEKGKENIT